MLFFFLQFILQIFIFNENNDVISLKLDHSCFTSGLLCCCAGAKLFSSPCICKSVCTNTYRNPYAAVLPLLLVAGLLQLHIVFNDANILHLA